MMEWNYKVILEGGERDGEVLCYTISYQAAVNYCNVYFFNHVAELAEAGTDLMILDRNENYVDW